jgi:hypothetical protein
MSDKNPIGLIHTVTGIAFALSACLSAYCIGSGNGVKEGKSQERLAIANEIAAAQVATDAAATALQAKIDQLAAQATQSATARQSAVKENRNASQSVLARPVYRTVCVDADGVRLLDQAADIANGHPPGAGLALPAGRTATPAETVTH